MSGLGRLIHRITTGDILSEVASNFSRTLTAWLSIGSTYTVSYSVKTRGGKKN